MGKCLDAAIEYATKYGWAVFPVSPNSKKPLTPHGCKDAKKKVGAIRAWWTRWPDASVGIATGSISNLIVIDEDLDAVAVDDQPQLQRIAVMVYLGPPLVNDRTP